MAPRPEPDKPPRAPCRHLCRKGCGIYQDRPKACREFECLWLASQSRLNLPKELRPDRTGVVLELNTHDNIIAHCKRPNDWERPLMWSFLMSMAAQISVIINQGQEDYSVLEPDGTLTKLKYIGVDDASNEHKFVRDINFAERQKSV